MDLYCRVAIVAFYEKNGFKVARDPVNDKALLRYSRVELLTQ